MITAGVVNIQSANTTFLMVTAIASRFPLKCALSMKNAVPNPVPKRTDALTMWMVLMSEKLSTGPPYSTNCHLTSKSAISASKSDNDMSPRQG